MPDGALCVAESGIEERAQVEELAAAGAHAFLIGGVLLQSEDPGAKLRELLGNGEGGGKGGTGPATGGAS